MPYYIPPWELRKHKDKWYHIDDVEMCEPLSNPSFNNRGIKMGTLVGKLVPYSFMPPLAKSQHWIPNTAKTSFTMSSIELEQSLGNLCSAPSDARIPLAF
jgi:hypothetical protein